LHRITRFTDILYYVNLLLALYIKNKIKKEDVVEAVTWWKFEISTEDAICFLKAIDGLELAKDATIEFSKKPGGQWDVRINFCSLFPAGQFINSIYEGSLREFKDIILK